MAQVNAPTPGATASYIEHMLEELRVLSNKINAPFLSYLLEMAIMEAHELAEGRVIPADGEMHTSVTPEELARKYLADELD